MTVEPATNDELIVKCHCGKKALYRVSNAFAIVSTLCQECLTNRLFKMPVIDTLKIQRIEDHQGPTTCPNCSNPVEHLVSISTMHYTRQHVSTKFGLAEVRVGYECWSCGYNLLQDPKWQTYLHSTNWYW